MITSLQPQDTSSNQWLDNKNNCILERNEFFVCWKQPKRCKFTVHIIFCCYLSGRRVLIKFSKSSAWRQGIGAYFLVLISASNWTKSGLIVYVTYTLNALSLTCTLSKSLLFISWLVMPSKWSSWRTLFICWARNLKVENSTRDISWQLTNRRVRV